MHQLQVALHVLRSEHVEHLRAEVHFHQIRSAYQPLIWAATQQIININNLLDSHQYPLQPLAQIAPMTPNRFGPNNEFPQFPENFIIKTTQIIITRHQKMMFTFVVQLAVPLLVGNQLLALTCLEATVNVHSKSKPLVFLLFDDLTQAYSGFFLAGNSSFYACKLDGATLTIMDYLGYSFFNLIQYRFKDSQFPLLKNKVYKYCAGAVQEGQRVALSDLACSFFHTYPLPSETICSLGNLVTSGEAAGGRVKLQVFAQTDGEQVTGDLMVSIVASSDSALPSLTYSIQVGKNTPQDLAIVKGIIVQDCILVNGKIIADSAAPPPQLNHINHWISYTGPANQVGSSAYFTVSRKLTTYDQFDQVIVAGTNICIKPLASLTDFNGIQSFCFTYSTGFLLTAALLAIPLTL